MCLVLSGMQRRLSHLSFHLEKTWISEEDVIDVHTLLYTLSITHVLYIPWGNYI